MAGMKDFLAKIRNLSEEKEKLTQSLEAENEDLRKQVGQVVEERDAFIKENQAIAELLLAEGLQPIASTTPKRQVVEHLLQERTETKNQLEEMTKENMEVTKKLDNLKVELEAKEKEHQSSLQSAHQNSVDVSKQLKSMEEVHIAERTKLKEERDQLKVDIVEHLSKLALMRAEVKELKSKTATSSRASEIQMTKLKKELEGESRMRHASQ